MSSTLIKYRNLSVTVKASFWFLIAGFLQKGISLITTPFFSRLLTTEEFGEYNVYNSWYNIIIIFATLNLASGVYMNGLVKYDDDRQEFTTSLLSLGTFTTLICLFIYILFNSFWNEIFGLPTSLVIVMFIDILVTMAFQFWSSNERVNFRYKQLIIVTVLNSFFKPTISIFVIMNTVYKVEARIFTIVAVDVFFYGILFYLLLSEGKKIYSKKYWKFALDFNIPLLPHYLSQIILSHSDRLMINKIVGTSQAGIYSLAYTAASVMTIVNTAVINTLNPWLYQKIKEKNYSEIGKNTTLLLLLIAISNLILIAFAPEVIAMLAPASYYEAIWIIPPVSASVFFMFMYSLFAGFEFYFGETKFVMFASVVCAGTNIILNYIFISKFGYLAAGYTTLVCYILYALAHYFFMRKINKKYMDGVIIYDSKLILLISIVFLIMCFGLMLLYSYAIIRYIIIISTIILLFMFRKWIMNLLINLRS